MRYYRNEKEIRVSETVVTLGKFDGIHIGHQKLIDLLMQEKKDGQVGVMFTFDLSGFRDLSILTEEERKEKAERLGLDVMVVWPFDHETMTMDPETFIREILIEKLHAKVVVVGEDYRFGSHRSGNVETLRHFSDVYGYKVVSVPKVTWKGEEVSSSRIRDCILRGNLEDANAMLGTPYQISGTIVHGRHLGHTIGIPTMNLTVPAEKLLPPYGVYASRTNVFGTLYDGISNLGVKPSVSSEEKLGLETHLFDYDEDDYGQRVVVSLFHFLRKEQKFDSLTALKKQIQQDTVSAKALLSLTSSEVPGK